MATNTRRCFLDLDGVLVDFIGGIHKKLGIEFSYDKWPYKFGPEGWNFHNHLGLSFEHMSELCDLKFWEDLSWMEDGADIYHTVCDFFSRDEITLLTMPMPNAMSASGKVLWVHKNLWGFRNRLMITTEKKHVLARTPDSILIDDNQGNVDEWCKAGGEAILVPRPWNRLHGAYHIATLTVRSGLGAFVCQEF